MYVLTWRIIAVFFLLAATAAAQTTAASWNTVKALTPGTDVRILNGSRTVSGKMEGVTDDAIVIRSRKGQETFKQPDVIRLSLRTNGHRARNGLIGLGVGAGVGLGVGAAADASCGSFCRNLGKGVFTPAGAIVGLAVGALIPAGGWREIYKRQGV